MLPLSLSWLLLKVPIVSVRLPSSLLVPHVFSELST